MSSPDRAMASLNVCNSGSGSLPGGGVDDTTILAAGLCDGGEPHTIIRGFGELLQRTKIVSIVHQNKLKYH